MKGRLLNRDAFVDEQGVIKLKHCFRVRSGRECQEVLGHDGPCVYKERMLKRVLLPGAKGGPSHVPARPLSPQRLNGYMAGLFTSPPAPPEQ